MTEIHYNIWATVHLLNKPDKPRFARGGAVWWGTLATAVRRVMAMPRDERICASIAVGEEAGTEKTLLAIDDIEAIYGRADFPSQSG